MEIQQSPLYKQYINSLGWRVDTIGSTNVFYKHFPVIGGLLKIQRPEVLPDIPALVAWCRNHRIRTIALEPAHTITQEEFRNYVYLLQTYGLRINKTPFLPTKTSIVDISPPEDVLFHSFSEAKQRAVRRATKNNVTVYPDQNIHTFIRVKNSSAGFCGFITTYGLDKLWSIFAPNNGAVLLASTKGAHDKPLAGVLTLYCHHTAYYWVAGSSPKGKRLFAPTLLVWEAMKAAKQHGCLRFDFVGIWDERTPKENKAWLGFTKFKEGFNGASFYYPIV